MRSMQAREPYVQTAIDSWFVSPTTLRQKQLLWVLCKFKTVPVFAVVLDMPSAPVGERLALADAPMKLKPIE